LLDAYRSIQEGTYYLAEDDQVIYVVALNEPFRSMVLPLVASARVFGKYYGDIIVFTDKLLEYELDKRVIVNTSILTEWKQDFTKMLVCQRQRIFVTKEYDFSKYSKIIYSDVDIVFINPLKDVFAQIPENGVVYAEEQRDRNNVHFGKMITKYNKIVSGKLGANSGFIGFDKGSFATFMGEWGDLLAHEQVMSDPSMLDQPVFNYVITFPGNTYNLKTFPDLMVEYPDFYKRKKGKFLNRISAEKNYVWHFINNVGNPNTVAEMYRLMDQLLLSKEANG